jgi:transporter family protein
VEVSALALLALGLRITLLGLERIYLKKLERFDSIVIASLFFLIASLFLTPILLVTTDPFIEMLKGSQSALISSAFYSIGFFLYVQAISLEDTSLIAPLYNSSLLWVLIFGFVFLDELVTPLRILGAVMIFVGVFFLYQGKLQDKLRAIKASTGSLYMILGSVFLAIGRTIDASAVRDVDPRFYALALNFYVGFYLLIGSLIWKRQADIFRSIREEPKNLVLAGITNGWSYLFLLIALQTIDLSIAEPLSLLSIFVTAFFAKIILGEDVRQRIPAMIVILVGSVVLFF